jgi:hypothetical protein
MSFEESFDKAMAATKRLPAVREIRDTVKGSTDGAYVVVDRGPYGKRMFYAGQGYEEPAKVWTSDGRKALRYNTNSETTGAGKVAAVVGGEVVQASFYLTPEHKEIGVEGPRGQGGSRWNYRDLLAAYGSWANKVVGGADPRDAADLVRTQYADDISFTRLYHVANLVRNAQGKAAGAMVIAVIAESPKGKTSKEWYRVSGWSKTYGMR